MLFLNNEKLFNMIIENLPKYQGLVMEDIFKVILPKIKSTEIYKKNKEEYDKKFEFIKEIGLIFPLLKFYENKEKEINYIYKFDNSEISLTENEYLKLLKVRKQIPQRVSLNTTFQKFSENIKLSRAFDIVIRRAMVVYSKYKSSYPHLMLGSFLYD